MATAQATSGVTVTLSDEEATKLLAVLDSVDWDEGEGEILADIYDAINEAKDYIFNHGDFKLEVLSDHVDDDYDEDCTIVLVKADA